MSKSPHRRPATFKLDDPAVILREAGEDAMRLARGTVQITPDPDPAQFPVPIEQILPPAKRGWRWGPLLWSALGGLIALGTGVSVLRLIDDLFALNAGLGALGLTLAAAALIAVGAIATREVRSLMRLATIERLHTRAAAALVSDDRDEGRAVVAELMTIARSNPRLARARADLDQHDGDIIDGADRIRLAERELLTPLDTEARRIVSAAAQRVSVVTAISPRAAIDILFVAVAALRMLRQLAQLYGARPGTLGLLKLIRQAVAHLAITGGVAASDSLIQQMLGHGIAAKLSARLGEGILNGLLTARLGLAAIDVVRPLPFASLPRPALSDLAKDLLSRRSEDE